MKNKKEIFGWAMFDFANSAYTTNIVTVIFCNYFILAVAENFEFTFLGWPLGGKSLWGLGTTASNLLIILTAPLLGAVADFSANRKTFLVGTCLFCVVGTAGLFFVTPGAIAVALVLFVVSNYFFQISESLCSSFLPDLAEPHEIGKISALGWSLGYIGGLVGLLICFPLIGGEGQGFGPGNQWNIRLTALITAGVFLFGAIPTFLYLKEKRQSGVLPAGTTYLSVGFSRVWQTLTHLRSLRDLSFFLAVFLLMSVALTTVFTFSTNYSLEEMKMPETQLVVLFIVVQASAALGAFVFGFFQDRMGLKFSVQLLLVAWWGTLLGVFFTHSLSIYWFLVVMLGAGLGSIQSAARAMVGLFAPRSKSAEIFGFWSLTYKLGGLVGPLMYGFIADSASHRWAMLFISSFFLLAFLLNFAVDEKRGRRAGLAFEEKLAGNPQ
jgi:UMF1 family MFS transporter